MATNTAPTYGYRTARQTTKLPSYYDSAPKPQPLFGGSFASSFLQSPLVAGATQAKPVAPQHPSQISPQGVAKQTTGFNEGTQATGQNQTTQPAATSPTGGLVYDYTADPILQQIQALSLQSRQDADTGALELRKQIAIKYGDPEYARNVLGDTGTADAAAGNPYSVYAQLKKQQHDAADSLDEQLNQNNLFYGGYRVKQQGQLADEYGRANAAESANEQAALGQVEQQRMAAYSAANDRDNQAAQQAQADALLRALQNASGGAFTAQQPDGLGQGAQSIWDQQTGGGPAAGTYDQLAATAGQVRGNLLEDGLPNLGVNGGYGTADDVQQALLAQGLPQVGVPSTGQTASAVQHALMAQGLPNLSPNTQATASAVQQALLGGGLPQLGVKKKKPL